MRSRYLPPLLIGASFLLALWLDSAVWPTHNTAIFYAIPLVLASRFASGRGVVAVTVLVLVLDFFSAQRTNIPPTLAVLRGVCLMLIALLAYWVARAREEEERRYRELERAREQLREFMGMVVHDLRGPLTVAMGYTDLTARALEGLDVDHVRVGRNLDRIAGGLQQIRQLIEDLLDVTRIGAGRFVVRRAPMDLAELVRDVVEEQQATGPEHRLVVEAPTHLTGEWDAVRLRQVLVNLISNAMRYSPAGTEVGIQVQPIDDTVKIAVSDQGYGIPPARQAQLFEPFARIGREREPTSTGLGLYITRGIVEAHGGRIWVSSVVGKGSTFFVELPNSGSQTRVPGDADQPLAS